MHQNVGNKKPLHLTQAFVVVEYKNMQCPFISCRQPSILLSLLLESNVNSSVSTNSTKFIWAPSNVSWSSKKRMKARCLKPELRVCSVMLWHSVPPNMAEFQWKRLNEIHMWSKCTWKESAAHVPTCFISRKHSVDLTTFDTENTCQNFILFNSVLCWCAKVLLPTEVKSNL